MFKSESIECAFISHFYFSPFKKHVECILENIYCECGHVLVFLWAETCSWEVQQWCVQWCPAAFQPNWSQNPCHPTNFSVIYSDEALPEMGCVGPSGGRHSTHDVTVRVWLWFSCNFLTSHFPVSHFDQYVRQMVMTLDWPPLIQPRGNTSRCATGCVLAGQWFILNTFKMLLDTEL